MTIQQGAPHVDYFVV